MDFARSGTPRATKFRPFFAASFGYSGRARRPCASWSIKLEIWGWRLPMAALLKILLLTLAAGFSQDPQAEGRTSAGKSVVGKIVKREGAAAQLESRDGSTLPLSALKEIKLKHAPGPTELPWPFTMQAGPLERLGISITSIESGVVKGQSKLGNIKAPVSWATSLEGLSQGAVVVRSDFSTIDKIKMSGEAALSSQSYSPPGSLELKGPSSSLSQTLTPPVSRGKFSLYFRDYTTAPESESRSVVLQFGSDPGLKLIVQLAGPQKSLAAELAGNKPTQSTPLPHKEGWRLLAISFERDSLIVAIDGVPMISSLRTGTEFPLTSFQISREVKGDAQGGSSPFLIDDLVVIESVARRAPLTSDPDQYDIMDRHGDQWFGSELAATNENVMLGKRSVSGESFSWRNVRSLRFPERKATDKSLQGEIGELELVDGSKLLVSLHHIDAKGWHVEHPALATGEGPILVPATAVVSWKPRLIGTRTEVFAGPFHLGEKLVSDFERPTPDGLSVRFTSNIVDSKLPTYLCLWIEGIEGIGPGSPFAAEIRAGELSTQLWINGREGGAINQYVQTKPNQPVELRIPLSSGLLNGQNDFVIQLKRSSKSKDVDDSEVQLIAIEQEDASLTKK